MFMTPYEQIKHLVSSIQKLEDKLMNTAILPMAEQSKIHAEILKYKKEIKLLEHRTRK
jgi:hypothetical protein